MFLDMTLRRNPDLMRLALELHQSGQIPPNTYVIDIDAVAKNSERLATEAARLGLTLYFMSKQVSRNEVFVQTVARMIPRAVAVDWDEAQALDAAGIPLGNVGHLVQTPSYGLDRLVALAPEYVTLFSVEKGLAVAEAAARQNRVQRVLLRIAVEPEAFYPGQAGGFTMAELPDAVRRLSRLPGLAVAGVTSFPCLLFDPESGRATPTVNLKALSEAAGLLRREFGIADPVVNAPSLTACGTLSLLAEAGATQGEPGHALTGTTPLHAFSEQPEVPAAVYVSEISHLYGGRAYCFGGGLYPRSRAESALVGAAWGRLGRLAVEQLPAEAIDYYGTLCPPAGTAPRVGETVLMAFRMQSFTSRSHMALVSGGRLAHLYDPAGRPLWSAEKEVGL